MREQRNPYDDPVFVARYARSRPGPPHDLIPLLTQLSGRPRPRLVVDLGCGTGLSTVAWSGHADRVVGIDANPMMQRHALPAKGVEYRPAPATDTRVRSGTVDVVTCSQSFHWMRPRPTIREVARILRRGGVFAAIDYALPPVIDPRLDPAFTALLRWAGLPPVPDEKSAHVRNLVGSGRFRWVGECALHGADTGNARRVTDLALSIAHVAARLPEGDASRDPHFLRLKRAARRTLGTGRRRFWWSYKTVLAVK